LEVKLWVKGVKSASTDTAFQKYMTMKFRNHMEYGLYNEVATDFEDIGIEYCNGNIKRINYELRLKRTFFTAFQF